MPSRGNTVSADAVDQLIEACMARLLAETAGKVSIADVLKLIELRREIAAEEPKEITVRWVETTESSESNG